MEVLLSRSSGRGYRPQRSAKQKKNGTGAKVLDANLSLNGTGPHKNSAVGPCFSGHTPDVPPLGARERVHGEA